MFTCMTVLSTQPPYKHIHVSGASERGFDLLDLLRSEKLGTHNAADAAAAFPLFLIFDDCLKIRGQTTRARPIACGS